MKLILIGFIACHYRYVIWAGLFQDCGVWCLLGERVGRVIHDGPVRVQKGSATIHNDPATVHNESVTMQKGSAIVQNDPATIQHGSASMQKYPAMMQKDAGGMQNDPASTQKGFGGTLSLFL